MVGVLIIALLASGAWIWRTITMREELAVVLAKSVERDLQAGDLRSSIINLDRAGGSLFGEIRYLNGGVRPKFTIKHEPAVFAPISIQMRVKGSDSDSQSAVLDFRFSPVAGLGYFLAIILPIVSGLGWYEYRRSMKRLARDVRQFGLLKAAEATEALAAQVSHDIRSPLSAINMVVKSIEGFPEEKREIVQSAANRINGIANDLLSRHKRVAGANLSHLQLSSGAALRLEPVVIADLLKRIGTEKFASLPQDSLSRFKVDVTRPLAAVSRIDEKELSRALSNLIDNAFESLEGASEGEVALALRASGQKEIAIIVSDNGKGIPDDVLAKLGKERISSGKEGSRSGSGLGVLHAVRVVEAMGGKFTIQSKVGVGTIITIRFARADFEHPRRSEFTLAPLPGSR